MATLTALDQALTDLAALLHRAAPLPDWRRQVLDVRCSPDGALASHRYDYELEDGRHDRGVSPEADARAAIYDLLDRHWALSQDSAATRWSRMTVWVERGGRFGADFEHRTDHEPGDVLRRA